MLSLFASNFLNTSAAFSLVMIVHSKGFRDSGVGSAMFKGARSMGLATTSTGLTSSLPNRPEIEAQPVKLVNSNRLVARISQRGAFFIDFICFSRILFLFS